MVYRTLWEAPYFEKGFEAVPRQAVGRIWSKVYKIVGDCNKEDVYNVWLAKSVTPDQRKKWLNAIHRLAQDDAATLESQGDNKDAPQPSESSDEEAVVFVNHQDCLKWLVDAEVSKKLQDEPPALILTDPPFNILRNPQDNKVLPTDVFNDGQKNRFASAVSGIAQPNHTVLLLFCDIREYGAWSSYACMRSYYVLLLTAVYVQGADAEQLVRSLHTFSVGERPVCRKGAAASIYDAPQRHLPHLVCPLLG